MANKLNTRIQNLYDTKENWKNASKPPLTGELLVFDQTTGEGSDGTIRIKVGDISRSIPDDLPYVTSTPPRTKIGERPYVPNPNKFIYTGYTISCGDALVNVPASFGDKCYITGIDSAVNSGSYSFYITPLDGYCWNDGGTDTVVIEWEIKKVDISTSVPILFSGTYSDGTDAGISFGGYNKLNFDMTKDHAELRLNVENNNYKLENAKLNLLDGQLPSGVTAELVSSSSGYWHIILNYEKWYSEENDSNLGKLRISVPATKNYTGISIEVDITSYVTKTLDECTWEEIDKIANSGNASKYFKVGDKKHVIVRHTPTNSKGDVGQEVVLRDLSLFIVGFEDTSMLSSSKSSSIIFGGFIKTVGNEDYFVALRPEDLGYNTTKGSTFYAAPLINDTTENTLLPSQTMTIDDTPLGKSNAYRWAYKVRQAIYREDSDHHVPEGHHPIITISKYCQRNFNDEYRYSPKEFFKLKLKSGAARLLPSASEILGNDNIYGDPSIHDDMLEYYNKVKKGTFNAPVYKTYDLENNINVALRTSSMREVFYNEYTGGDGPDWIEPDYSGSVSLCYMSTPDIEHDPHTVIIKEDNYSTSEVGIAPIFNVGGPI